ncbi:NAD(P)-binding protein [Melanomma pulvis-pyrius CBS 109.77]|uniref:NAD(P)-binding protein n=1 Tax=Melanomma pulvis-pyrius CBS 109.77 TaxID=1314802 RepID=A0A6A6X3A0_9PLEO|nr:NAD(P)-binding protein [Melanomma pulvis-pyrius CBS 109.77]
MVNADKLRNKKIVVVGGSSGIGYGAAQALLEYGASVTIISSSQERVDASVKNLQEKTASGQVDGRVGNVRDEESFVQLLRELAPVDHIIFSSVDKIIRGPLSSLDLNHAKNLFGVKFWGAIVVGKAVAQNDIIVAGGSLTLTSGTAGIKPGKQASVGGALNGGVLSLTKGLAGELAEKKIRVNTVVPGLVKTELWDKIWDESKKEELFNSGKNLPVGFVATPDDIAEAYVYLIRANYATGTLVTIDGGGLLN